MRRKVIVIGGGASGLTAAIWSARGGADTVIVEHMDRVGKKILSTGNGRCNLTNRKMDASCYRSNQADFPMQVIGAFDVEETLAFFGELGIEPKDRNGYIYPASDQAASVLDVLRQEIEHLGVVTLTDCKARTIRRTKRGRILVETSQGALEADAVILCAGSKAAPVTGSDGSGYELAKSAGHRIIKPLPALVQLRCQGKHYKQLAGIRADARLTLFCGNEELVRERGELQLTDYGLSGIPTFQISRFAARELDAGKSVHVRVDFLPDWSEPEAFGRLKRRAQNLAHKPAGEFFTGLLNRKLAVVLLKAAGISLEQRVGTLSGRQLSQLLAQLKSYEALVASVNPFANAQVCCGGVDVREVDGATMQSKVFSGLYLAGEILDVDGICGGYNLQFAWSSGAIAGKSAAKGGNT